MDKLLAAQKNAEVLGLSGVSGVAARLDIDKLLYEQPDTFNLFALALVQLQKAGPADLMGWFQLAGIHGLPKALWDNVAWAPENVNSSSISGYCVHSTSTFATWHRPYLALLEQTLFLKMTSIAETFPGANKQTYRDAAKKFRLPYWDYYRPRGGKVTFPGIFNGQTSFPYDFSVPKIFTVDRIMLKTPDKADELQPVQNPFKLFSFATGGSIPQRDWDIWDNTFFPWTTSRNLRR